MTKNDTPTLTTYAEWQRAYYYFNKALFGGQLPESLITLDRKSKRTRGYFAPNCYKNIEGETKDGFALNPYYFRRRGLVDTLSYLVHEMCHIWQKYYGCKN